MNYIKMLSENFHTFLEEQLKVYLTKQLLPFFTKKTRQESNVSLFHKEVLPLQDMQ